MPDSLYSLPYSWSLEAIILICTEIRLKGIQSRSNRSTLLALACTCRAWGEVALDNLWHTIYSTRPLWYLMHWEDEPYSSRPPMVSELQGFYRYSSRIRALILQNPDLLSSSDRRWDFLSPYLLPNLKLLVWHQWGNEPPPFFRLTPNPRIENFKVGYPEGLALPDPRLRPWTGSQPRRPWDRLSGLHLNDATIDSLVYIAEMPKLKHLVFDNLRLMWGSFSPKESIRGQLVTHLTSIEHRFPTLQSLEIVTQGDHINAATLLFTRFQQVSLSRIKVSFLCEDDTVEDLVEFMQILHRHCNTKTLKSFELCYWNLEPTWSEVMLPLCVFPALERVKIFGHRAMNIEPGQAATMASAWPNIRVLEITPRHVQGELPETTLLSLIPLAECPKLRHLGITICADGMMTRSMLQKHPSQRPRCLSLRTLYVGNSSISDDDEVAEFLSEIFPNLEDIKSNLDDEEPEFNRAWQHIAQVQLPMLNRVRAAVRGEKRLFGTVNVKEERKGTGMWYCRDREEKDFDWSDVEETEVMRDRESCEDSEEVSDGEVTYPSAFIFGH